MEIKGFLKNSFVDWDGRISSVIFLPGCNFRCAFCHNMPLVTGYDNIASIDISEIIDYLEKNRNFIDGVVVTGGEPTIHDDLPLLLEKIKQTCFPVKLDTNGSNPEMLSEILGKKIIDYVAMDIKAPLDRKYNEITRTDIDVEKIRKSIEIIMQSATDYEFRTTVIDGFHGEQDIESISCSIRGAMKYALQRFMPDNVLPGSGLEMKTPSEKFMQELRKTAEKNVANVVVRN